MHSKCAHRVGMFLFVFLLTYSIISDCTSLDYISQTPIALAVNMLSDILTKNVKRDKRNNDKIDSLNENGK